MFVITENVLKVFFKNLSNISSKFTVHLLDKLDRDGNDYTFLVIDYEKMRSVSLSTLLEFTVSFFIKCLPRILKGHTFILDMNSISIWRL